MVGSRSPWSSISWIGLLRLLVVVAEFFRLLFGFTILNLNVSLTGLSQIVGGVTVVFDGLFRFLGLFWVAGTMAEVIGFDALPLTGGDEPLPVRRGVVVNNFEFDFDWIF